jgi:CRP/FNR family nitrogen fixation transcriptional regulator
MLTENVPQISRLPASTIGIRLPAAATPRIETRREPLAGLVRSFSKDEELFAEGDEAECFCEVKSGTVRTYKLLSDGRRLIDAFHFAGDIFGIEFGAEHRFSAEAVADVTVVAYRRSRLATVAETDPAFGDRVMAATLRSLERAQSHMLLLGRKTAQEKMATFLLDMADRLSDDDQHFELPMQRADIADHLGLTIETVSRTLTRFARKGLIDLPASSRSVALRNKPALRRLEA